MAEPTEKLELEIDYSILPQGSGSDWNKVFWNSELAFLTSHVSSLQEGHLAQLYKTAIQNYSLGFCYAKGKWGQPELFQEKLFLLFP